MAPTLTKEEQIAAFHELWDRRYKLLGSQRLIQEVAKINLNDRYFAEINCCRYDFCIFLVERGILHDDQDIMVMRRMDSGRIYPRICGDLLASSNGWITQKRLIRNSLSSSC